MVKDGDTRNRMQPLHVTIMDYNWKSELDLVLQHYEANQELNAKEKLRLRKVMQFIHESGGFTYKRIMNEMKMIDEEYPSVGTIRRFIMGEREVSPKYLQCIIEWCRQIKEDLPVPLVLGKRGHDAMEEDDENDEEEIDPSLRQTAKKSPPLARPVAAAAQPPPPALPDMYHVLFIDNSAHPESMQALADKMQQWPGTVICPIYTQLDKKTLEETVKLFVGSVTIYNTMLSKNVGKSKRRHRVIIGITGTIRKADEKTSQFVCTDGQGILPVTLLAHLRALTHCEVLMLLDMHMEKQFLYCAMENVTVLCVGQNDATVPLTLFGDMARSCDTVADPFSLINLQAVAEHGRESAKWFYQINCSRI